MEKETFEEYKSRKGIITNEQSTIELGLDACSILYEFYKDIKEIKLTKQ